MSKTQEARWKRQEDLWDEESKEWFWGTDLQVMRLGQYWIKSTFCW